MTTIPSFIYLPRGRRLGTPSTSLDLRNEGLLCEQSFDEDGGLEKKPGVWWKDEKKWVLYDRKIARRILKAQEIGLPKVKLSKSAPESALASSPDSLYGNAPANPRIFHTNRLGHSRRTDSSDSSSSTHSSNTGTAEYEVDLVKMKEVHLESGNSRDIKIVRVPMTGCVFMTFSTSTDSGAKYSIDVKKTSRILVQNMEEEKFMVSWKDEVGGWCLYDDICQNAIWRAWSAGEKCVTTENVTSKMCSKGAKYIIDLKTMQQTNPDTGDRRPIQIALWVSSSRFPHIWTGADIEYLAQERRQGNLPFDEQEIMLHKLALSRLFSPEYVRRAISENMEHDTLQSFEMNSDLSNSGHWNSFLHSFNQRLKEIPDYLGHLWRFALNPNGHHHPLNPFSSRNSNFLWRFVFGAPSDGLEGQGSMKFGANTLPSKYHTHIDWFGLSTAITEFYCKPISPIADGCVSMLVFLALMPRNYHDSGQRVLFLTNLKDYLPVASITVHIDDTTLGPACSLWEERDLQNSPTPSSREGNLSSGSESRRWSRKVMVEPGLSPAKLSMI